MPSDLPAAALLSMDYGQFRKPKRGGKTAEAKAVTASLRAVSYLWDSTVPDNPFKTDGKVANVPSTWPGDDLVHCRQWQGVDLTATFLPNGTVDSASIKLRALSYSGTTDTCGLIGKTTVTDRHVTEPRIGGQGASNYVEVKTLLGTRLGAFIPDIEPALSSGLPQVPGADLVQHLMETAVLKMVEGRYLGTDSMTPKIFTYARLRLSKFAVKGDWVSDQRGSGFVSQASIVERQLGSSWIPEHHLYVNGALQGGRSLASPSTDDLLKWIDSPLPGDAFGFQAISAALKKWDKDTARSEKVRWTRAFARTFPDYFIGTDFQP
jgi:hypothetical protein